MHQWIGGIDEMNEKHVVVVVVDEEEEEVEDRTSRRPAPHRGACLGNGDLKLLIDIPAGTLFHLNTLLWLSEQLVYIDTLAGT